MAIDGSSFNASAAFRNGYLFIGDSDGMFYCVDAAKGKEKWKFKTDAEIDSSANFYHGQVVFGSQDATLYCLNADTGAVVWKHKVQDQIRCSPTVVEDRAFVAGCDGKLHIIDLTNGNDVANVDIEAPTGSTPAVHGDVVYFGTEGGTFFAIDWKRATIVWRWEDKARTDPLRLQRRARPRRRDLRQPRQTLAGPGACDGQSALVVFDAWPDRRFAGHRRRSRVFWSLRRANLWRRSAHGQESLGIRSRRLVQRRGGGGRRAVARRQRRRGGILFWREMNERAAHEVSGSTTGRGDEDRLLRARLSRISK